MICFVGCRLLTASATLLVSAIPWRWWWRRTPSRARSSSLRCGIPWPWSAVAAAIPALHRRVAPRRSWTLDIWQWAGGPASDRAAADQAGRDGIG